MALGFGFNKVKVLGAAEKFVQQGKLQSAIAEYEKVIKEDPKDLTVLNTIGDLYARVGQNDRASEYFKKVGDQYAQNGFNIKAIAFYKKLTRMAPAANESLIRLAELYAVEGLFSDARAQYMQAADQLLKGGDLAYAARIFQKILELEPENTNTQTKLADLYIKIGKKQDACAIYYQAAQSLNARGSFDAADDALKHVLSLDPNNGGALLLRGMIAADSGDGVAAIACLERISDLDSRPDALRALLKARLQSGKMNGVEETAGKMLTLHNDPTGVSALAEWFLANHRPQDAFHLYERHAELFLSKNSGGLLETLYPLIGRIGNDTATLLSMLHLLQKAGDKSHLNEVMELLAHAYVQEGEFEKARDLYKELADAEPENPLHGQNYKQMLAKLGQDSMARPLSVAEASQAFMVEELERGSPPVQQNYSPAAEKAIEAAITDAELFVSYNVPLKAIAPLETALHFAPRDANINQRLATLYAKAERYSDAARACRTLSEVYAQFGHQSQAASYADAARKYAEKAGEAVEPAAPQPAPHVEMEAAATSQVREFDLDMAGDMAGEAMAVEPVEAAPAAPVHSIIDEAPPEATVSGFGFELAPEAQPETVSLAAEEIPAASSSQPFAEQEISISSEWEDMLSVEEPPEPEVAESATVSALIDPEFSVGSESAVDLEPAGTPDLSLVADKVQEIRFYIEQGLWDNAKSAIRDLAGIAPNAPEVDELVAEISKGQLKARKAASAPMEKPPAPVIAPPAAAAPEAASFEPEVREIIPFETMEPEPVEPSAPPARRATLPPTAPATPAAPILQEFFQNLPATKPPSAPPPAPVRVQTTPPALSAEPEEPAFDDFVLEVPVEPPAAISAAPAPSPGTSVAQPKTEPKAPVEIARPAAPTSPAKREPEFSAPAASSKLAQRQSVEDALVLDVPDDLSTASPGKRELPASSSAKPAARPVEPPALPPAAAAKSTPVARGESTEDVLGHFVMDLEASLGEFLPVAEAPAQTPKLEPRELRPQAVESPPAKPTAPPPPAARAPEVSVLPDEILDLELPLPEEVKPPLPAPPPLSAPPQRMAREDGIRADTAHRNGDTTPRDPEAASILGDILHELQDETGTVTLEAEDPDTHYNLGIAFKEMGLLDEAIGELQKVCHAVERGNEFSQPIQAFTWLAQCLVDKGVPEAAVRWYEQALKLPGLDVSSRCSIYYDMGSAYEAYGDRKSALLNFMEVYSANIDFRDVANRIKVLKS